MCKYYLIKNISGNNTFAIILERTRKEETLEALRIAINEEFICYCKLGDIDLNKVQYNKPQILHVTAPLEGESGYMELNIEVSTTHLY